MMSCSWQTHVFAIWRCNMFGLGFLSKLCSASLWWALALEVYLRFDRNLMDLDHPFLCPWASHFTNHEYGCQHGHKLYIEKASHSCQLEASKYICQKGGLWNFWSSEGTLVGYGLSFHGHDRLLGSFWQRDSSLARIASLYSTVMTDFLTLSDQETPPWLGLPLCLHIPSLCWSPSLSPIPYEHVVLAGPSWKGWQRLWVSRLVCTNLHHLW